MIDIVPYSSTWAQAFQAESMELQRVLGSRAVRIEHVGSTAVPGLAAKPVIDIQVSVQSLGLMSEFQVALGTLGYKFVSNGDFDLEYPWFAKPGQWPSTHHVHLCVAGAEQEAKHLAFRDFLRMNQEQALHYERLKRRLAAEHDGNSFNSVVDYPLGKSEFIAKALASAARN